jgi:hypothetical protein
MTDTFASEFKMEDKSFVVRLAPDILSVEQK